MQMKKKLAVVAIIAAAVLVGATAPVSAESLLCSMEATTFEVWFYQVFYC